MSNPTFRLYDPETPLRIVTLAQTTTAYPAQWEGLTADYAEVYIRYRGGYLSIHVGPYETAAAAEELWLWETMSTINDGGWMSDWDLRQTLPDWIVLPDGFGDSRYEGISTG